MRMRALFLLVAGFSSFILTACAGGGGGGGTIVSPPPVSPPPPPPPPPPSPPPPVAGVDYPQPTSSEFTRQWGLNAIGVQTAWARGAYGNGIAVGVVDTGVDPNATEISANLRFNKDMVTTRTTATDWSNTLKDSSNKDVANPQRHGTGVAEFIGGVFNGSGTVGVAFKSSILSYQVNNDGTCTLAKDCAMNESLITKAVDQAIADGAKIINFSLGSGTDPTGALFEQALLRATNAGIIAVIASGNESLAEPGWPGKFANDPRFKGRIIIVGAVDYQNNMPAFSNKAGIYGNYYISAPGTSTKDPSDPSGNTYISGARLITDCANGSCWITSGTSDAAPHVSGALALVLQAFPNLTVDQAISLIMTTATDIGATGIDTTYGVGFLNLAKAFAPVGITTTSLDNGMMISINDFNAVSGASFGNAFQNSDLETGVLDSYGRSFNVNLGQRFVTQKTQLFAGGQLNQMNSQNIMTSNGYYSFTPKFADAKAWGKTSTNENIASIYAINEIGEMGKLGNLKIAYGINSVSLLSQTQKPMNEFEKFGIHALNASNSNIGIGLTKGAFGINFINSKANENPYGVLSRNQTNTSSIEFGVKNPKFGVDFELGQMSEDGKAWGTRFSDSNGPASAQTKFVGFDASFRPQVNYLIDVRAQFAKMQNANLGLVFDQTQTVRANAFGVNLYRFDKNGNWRFGFEQPMRNYSGALNYNFADPYSDWLAPQTHSLRNISLVPDGREIRFTFARDLRLDNNSNLSFGIGQISEAGHSKESSKISHIFIRGARKF